MYFVVDCAAQKFDSINSVLYPNPTLGLEHSSLTLYELMHAGYYLWDTQALHSYSHAHSLSNSQSRLERTGRIDVQAVQGLAANEFTSVNNEGEYISVRTFSLNVYQKEVVPVFIAQLKDTIQLLYNIDQQHQDQLFCLS